MLEDLPDEEPDPICSALSGEAMRHIRGCREKLPNRLRRVYDLAYEEQLSEHEIAELLSIPPESVVDRKTRIRELMRGCLVATDYFYEHVAERPQTEGN